MIYAPITNEPLRQHLAGLESDGLHVFTAANGLFCGSVFHGTQLVNRMRAQHHLGILETMMLGQACLCAALMIQLTHEHQSLQLRYETDGPAVGFSVEADSAGFVRGYLFQNPIPISSPLENWDLAPFLGNGSISVTRFFKAAPDANSQIQQGIAEIKYRNIAKDLTWYFQQSEQLHTAFNTGIRFDAAGNVIGAGGFFLQRMSTASAPHSRMQKTEEEIESCVIRAERAFSACPPLGDWFSEGGNCEDLIFGLLREFDPQPVAVRKIDFNCPCSKASYVQAIRKLSKQERASLKDASGDPLEVVCRNCSSTYHIPLSEL